MGNSCCVHVSHRYHTGGSPEAELEGAQEYNACCQAKEPEAVDRWDLEHPQDALTYLNTIALEQRVCWAWWCLTSVPPREDCVFFFHWVAMGRPHLVQWSIKIVLYRWQVKYVRKLAQSYFGNKTLPVLLTTSQAWLACAGVFVHTPVLCVCCILTCKCSRATRFICSTCTFV